MKKIIFIISLLSSALIGNTQTLQSVTDNGNLTSNELLIKGDDKPVTVSLTTYNYSGNPIGAKLGAWSAYGTAGIKFHRWRGGSASNFQVAYIGQMPYNLDYGLDFRTNSVSTLTDATTSRMFISSNTGNIGIGTTSPSGKLDINPGGWGNIPKISFNQQNDHPSMRMYRPTGDGSLAYPWWIENSSSGKLIFKSGRPAEIGQEGVTSKMTILSDGRVGIGTTNPDTELTVKGTIHSEEVKVDLNVRAPDYVFETNYKLRTLEQTKKYISENKHLPEIPSATELGVNGIDLGGMNMLLLKKIEELTLYVIEQNERLLQLESKNTEINELKNKIHLLENEK